MNFLVSLSAKLLGGLGGGIGCPAGEGSVSPDANWKRCDYGAPKISLHWTPSEYFQFIIIFWDGYCVKRSRQML